MPKITQDRRYYIWFFAVSFIFLIIAGSMQTLDYLSDSGVAFGVVAAILFLVYGLFYIEGRKSKAYRGGVLDACFALSIVNFLFMFILSGPIFKVLVSTNTYNLYTIIISTVFVAAVSFPLFLATYLLNNVKGKNVALFSYIIFAIVIALVVFYFVSGLFIKYYTIDDEIFIAIRDIHYLFMGINPYQNSVAQQLYLNHTYTGLTMTTNNQIVGISNYPALYLFSYLPFYFVAAPTIYNIEHYIIPWQGAVFFTILLFVIAFSLHKKYLKSPVQAVLLFVFIGLIFLDVESVISYLMLALLILAYTQTGRKYSWLFFGLCIALQELLWIPIILLLAYETNNYGIKKGVSDIFGAAVVFLLINSYFIALGPATFFKAVFNPLDKLLIPVSTSSILGFLLLANYHILLSTYTAIFGISILIAILACLYSNKKPMIALLSVIPILFLSRAMMTYYVLFVALLFVAIFIETDKPEKGFIEKYLHERKALFVSAMLFLAILLVGVVYLSHISYVRRFNVAISNQTLYFNSSLNQSVYTANLHYKNIAVNDTYIIFLGYTDQNPQVYGLFNDSIINTSVKCASPDPGCLLNVNRIALNGSSGNYTIRAYLGKNQTVEEGRLLMYNGNYFYFSDSVYNGTR